MIEIRSFHSPILMSNFHQLVLINGMAASGKSTFAKFCIDYAKRKYGVNGEELSTVDWVKEVAQFCGWDGQKTELDRRFLSDLKFALERWDGSPVTSVLDKLQKHPKEESWISFVNCREPRNIDDFIQLNMETINWPWVTVLVQNDRAPKITSNPADAGVFNYNYNIYINNNSDLIALRQEAERFVDDLWGEFCERESNKLGILVSAFPGCGKSWMAQHSDKYDILDLDSADFHWFDKEKRTENIYFPSNYVRQALAELEKYDFVFISTHKEVRDYIREHVMVNQPVGVSYFIVYPEGTESNRGTWLNRIRNRRGAQDDSLIAGLASHWYDWLDELSMDTTPVHYVLDCNNTPYTNGMWLDDKVLGNLEAIAEDLRK